MNDKTAYALRKDGMWMAVCHDGMIEEFLANGRLARVPTCLYTDRFLDALALESKERATRLANLVGAEVVKVKARKDEDETCGQ